MQATMKRGLAWIAAVAIALTVGAFASTTQAYAVDPIASGDVAVTKDFQMSPTLECPTETFNFSFTLQSVNGLTPDADHDGGAISTAEIAYNQTDNPAKTSVSRVDFARGLFPAKGDATYFKHGGEYVYVVKEVVPDSPTPGITYNTSDQVYLLHVYVENDSLDITSVGTWLAEEGATFEQDGQYVDDTKVNGVEPTIDQTTGKITAGGGMLFTNRYTKTAPLDIKKVITGTYADKTKLFDFSTALTIPETNKSTAEQTFTAEIWKDNAKVADSTDVVFTVAANATSSNTQTYKLTDGQYLHFAGLPVGTKYVLSETGLADTNYTPVADITGPATKKVTGSKSTNLEITDDKAENNNVVIETTDEGKYGSTVVTNTYDSPTPTGILIENLPWVLLIGAAAAGLIVFVVSRRNKKVRVA